MCDDCGVVCIVYRLGVCVAMAVQQLLQQTSTWVLDVCGILAAALARRRETERTDSRVDSLTQ